MIYISTAIYAEAKPIIEHFQLKKMPASSRFQLFANGQITLIVGGVGPFAAAVSTTYMLAKHQAMERDSFINIGICGSVSNQFQKGDAFLCHKIIHHDTKKSYYPDLLIRHPFQERVLETFAQPVNRHQNPDVRGDLVDMEGSGCFEAASIFLPPHQLYFVKIVSDHLKGDNIAAEHVSNYIAGNILGIEQLLQAAAGIQSESGEILTKPELFLLEQANERLRLSATMRHQLRQLAVQYKIRMGHPPDFFGFFPPSEVKTKQEGKIIFEQIKKQLLYD